MPIETFRWNHKLYDVSAILRNVSSGNLEPITLGWPASAVRAYFDLYLDERAPNPRPPLFVNIEYALSLPESRLLDPVIMVHVEEDGLIEYEEADGVPRHVIADGNHRIALAAMKGVGLSSLVLSRCQTEPYESFIA